MGGKSILSQLLSPYRGMYQTGGLVQANKNAGVNTTAMSQQPADTTNTYGNNTMPGMDFTFDSGIAGGGALDWTQENFDAGAATGGGNTRDPDWTVDSPFGPTGATTWEEVWGSQWGDSNPGMFDWSDPSTWPAGWQPGMESPGRSEWFTGGTNPDTGESYTGPGGSGEPGMFDPGYSGFSIDWAPGTGSYWGFGSGDSYLEPGEFDDFNWGFDYGLPQEESTGYAQVTGSSGVSPFGALSMKTAQGYNPGKFEGYKVRRQPQVAPQAQNQTSIKDDILKHLYSDAPSAMQEGQSEVIDAVLNELRI